MLTLLAALAIAAPVPVAKTWVGTKVVAKAEDAKLTDKDSSGNEVELASPYVVLEVVKDAGDRVRLKWRGGEGWAAKADWLPVKEAAPFFQKLAAADPMDDFPLTRLAAVHIHLGDYDDAVAAYDALVKLDAGNGYYLVGRGEAYAQKGDDDKARADFDKALDLDDEDESALLSRADYFVRKKEFAKAQKDLDEVIRLSPDDAGGYTARGAMWLAKKDYAKAIDDYDTAIRLDPKDALVLTGRADVYHQMKEYAKARADYDAALKLDPGTDSWNGLAWFLSTCPDEKFRDGKKAVAFATKACEASLWDDPNAVDTLACAYAEVGDFANAVKYQKAALAAKTFPVTIRAEAKERLKGFEEKKPWRAK